MREYVSWDASSHAPLTQPYITVMAARSRDWLRREVGSARRISSCSPLLLSCIAPGSTLWMVRLASPDGKPCLAHKPIGFAGFPNNWGSTCLPKRAL